jgi:predicted nucleic acid-binding protein
LVVGDVNLYVRAIGGHSDCAERKVVEAASLGVIVLVCSEQIRRETVEVLSRPELSDLSEEQAADLMGRICSTARMVEPAADEARYLSAVRDVDDVIILRTAVGTYLEQDLAEMTQRYIVSGDVRAFPAGRNYYGFKCLGAPRFWQELKGESEDPSS